MKALFNNNLIDTPLPVMPDNRAFQFGDGLFETIWFSNGRVPLLSEHLRRIRQSAELLDLEVSKTELKFLTDNIDTLRQLNLPEHADVTAKFMIWRHSSERPGYWADFTSTDSLLTVRPYVQDNRLYKTGICRRIRICNYPWASSKNLNALPYVMASRECIEREMNELVMFNQNGEAAECISSNLFIYTKDEGWITPPLSSGGVAGTMRAFILKSLQKEFGIREDIVDEEQIIQAEAMLLSRSTGCQVVGTFEGNELTTEPSENLKRRIMEILF